MRIAYFDTIGGAAGDMILGSLLDAGLPFENLERELAKLPITGYRLRRETVQKQGITATQFLVDLEGGDHHHHGDEESHQQPGRSLVSIERLIQESDLARPVKDRALRIFRRLGEAEARIHGVPVEEVHFHEIGSIDSIVDIVGAAIALDLLHIERIYASPLPMGSGTIETQHGTYPIPAPATLELVAMARAPVVPSTVHSEQVTPTGAAILTMLAEFVRPPMTVERVGYGAGQADLTLPNVLRVWIGESAGATEQLVVLATNIDDMNPELYPHVVERLFEMGALDALLVPVIMKKGRPGVKVEVLCRPEDQSRLTDLLLTETTTLGVRASRVERLAAEREMGRVETPYGSVAVKIKRSAGRSIAMSPELEDCRRLAREHGVPLIEVYRAAEAAGRSLIER